MSCSVRGGSYEGSYGGRRECVKDVVKKILDAQRKATDDFLCITGCDTSIDDLLSPQRHNRPHRHDTIPFMLFTKCDVKPFVGSGFTSWVGRHGDRRGNFRCVESPFFKVKGFSRGSDSCVTLELLEPIKDRGRHDRHHSEGDVEKGKHHNDCGCSMCKRFGSHHFENFCLTGVCITVDLDCFCAISCLDPVRVESRFD